MPTCTFSSSVACSTICPLSSLTTGTSEPLGEDGMRPCLCALFTTAAQKARAESSPSPIIGSTSRTPALSRSGPAVPGPRLLSSSRTSERLGLARQQAAILRPRRFRLSTSFVALTWTSCALGVCTYFSLFACYVSGTSCTVACRCRLLPPPTHIPHTVLRVVEVVYLSLQDRS